MRFFDYPRRGVDLSKYNGRVDHAKLAKSGILFCIIRVGYGRVTDREFAHNWGECKCQRMGYWYMDYYSNHDPTSTANGISDTDWGKRQADVCWERIKDNNDGGLVWLDIESGSPSYSPPIYTVWARAEAIARAFLERIDALNGKVNGIYSSISKFGEYSDWFKGRPAWVAWYTETQTPEKVAAAVEKKGFTPYIWQYTSRADMDGDGQGDGKAYGIPVNDDLDLNVWIGSEENWTAMTGKGNDMLLNIEPLGQKDTRWRYDKLGTSASTIGGYGCLITCASMMLRYFGFDTDPGRLNKWLIANSGYHNDNLFVWGSMNGYDERITFGARYNYAALDKVDAQLAKGLPVIVNVDLNPATPALDEHWVLVVGKVDGSYMINDPWYGTQLKFEEKYGNPSTGMRIVCTYEFSGEIVPPAPTPEPAPIEVGQKVRTLVGLNIRKGAGTNYGVWATAPKGTLLDMLEIKGDWIRCGWNQWALSVYNGVRYLG